MSEYHHLIAIAPGQGCSRRHAVKTFAATFGGVVLSGPLARAIAALPWAEHPEATPLENDSLPLSVGRMQQYEKQIRQYHPTIALETDANRLWTSWTGFVDGAERIQLRSFSTTDESWGDVLTVSDAGTALQSEIAIVGNHVITVWSDIHPGGWVLRARILDLDSAEFGPIRCLAGSPDGGEIHRQVAIAAQDGQALVVWQTKRPGQQPFSIAARLLDSNATPVDAELMLATHGNQDCCRPAVTGIPGGAGWAVAFDRQDGPGSHNVYMLMLDSAAKPTPQPITVSNHPAGDIAPSLATSPDGRWVWVAWHSNRHGADGWDIPRWYRLAAYDTRTAMMHRPAAGLYAGDRDARGTVQGFEMTRLAVAPGGAVCVLGRPSHNFALQYYTAEGYSPLYSLPKDGWGGRGRTLRGTFDAAGMLWVVRRDLGANVLQRVGGLDISAGPPPMEADPEPQQPPARKLAGIHTRTLWPVPTANVDEQELGLYFGDIHGHSWQSDGTGDPEECYARARDVLGDDFHVLTDHDRFVGKRVGDAQWHEQKDIVQHYNAPGKFVTIFGQEWTSPRTTVRHGWGHFNVYSADPTIPLFDHGDPRYRDLPDLLAAIRPYQAIAIPHHIGWTGAPWEAFDPGLVPVVEVCSVHGAFEYEGNEPIRHRGGLKGCFVRDGLNTGVRFGMVGGSDQHGLIWHHGVCWKRNAFRAGLTGVWAPELTRTALLDAIRARRTFATTGVKLCPQFSIEGKIVGAEVSVSGPPTITADIAVPPEEGRLAWVQIIRNGEVISHQGGEPQRARFTFADEQCPGGGTSYYYLRILLTNNNMAWTSPIWVTRT